MREFLYRVERKAKERSREICQDIVDEIQSNPNTPRDTGKLAEGYHVVETPKGHDVVTEVKYWEAVEKGHDVVNQYGRTIGHVEPQAHVAPAVEIVRARLKK